MLLVGAGLLLWRLSVGPIAVPFVTPILEAALAADESAYDIDVGETWLDWSGLNQSMELRIVDTVVRDRQGKELVSDPARVGCASPRAGCWRARCARKRCDRKVCVCALGRS
ncbi:MAG: hypothetical protein C6Y20_12255, partial [Tagaea sp. CACIAM 22H2]|nr:hypothetical protein [Tagaea sp. CACIAM 22H2]